MCVCVCVLVLLLFLSQCSAQRNGKACRSRRTGVAWRVASNVSSVVCGIWCVYILYLSLRGMGTIEKKRVAVDCDLGKKTHATKSHPEVKPFRKR